MIRKYFATYIIFSAFVVLYLLRVTLHTAHAIDY